MKYKIGDKVRIKSLDWYNENKNNENYIDLIRDNDHGFNFIETMAAFCGKVMIISGVTCDYYNMLEDSGEYYWTDDMIEGLVEEDKPKFKVGDKITNGKENYIISHIAYNKYIVEDNLGEYDTLYFDTQNDWELLREKVIATNEPFEKETEWSLPDGYIFKDENGNVINATKIVLEKKEKEYPKTYAECCNLLGCKPIVGFAGLDDNEEDLYGKFIALKRCRDAYWKIAGEEMGLGKPWEPDWSDNYQKKWTINFYQNEINLTNGPNVHFVLAFPTEEMRDAFKKNFDKDLEFCKELL